VSTAVATSRGLEVFIVFSDKHDSRAQRADILDVYLIALAMVVFFAGVAGPGFWALSQMDAVQQLVAEVTRCV